MSNETSKEFYALNLNDKNAQLIVKNANEKIEELRNKQESMQPELAGKRDAMQRAQDDYELTHLIWQELEDSVIENQTIIRAFTKYDENNSKIKILRTEGERKIGEHTKNIRWTYEAVKLLKEQNRFMDFDEMFEFFKNNEDIKKGAAKNKLGRSLDDLKTAVVSNFLHHCNSDFTRENSKKLVVYEGKFGLVDWLNVDGSLKASHLKEFMYNATTNKRSF